MVLGVNVRMVEAADLLINPSFEQPQLAAGAVKNFFSGEIIGSGWVVINGNAAIITDAYNGGGATWPDPTEGNQFLYIGDIGQSTAIYQDINLLSNSNYNLSFDLANFPSGNLNSARLEVDILFNNNSILSAPIIFTRPQFSGFTTERMNFQTFSTGVYRLVLNQPGGFGTNVDNFKLTQSVPEPSTYVLGLIAAGAIGFVASRCKSHQKQA